MITERDFAYSFAFVRMSIPSFFLPCYWKCSWKPQSISCNPNVSIETKTHQREISRNEKRTSDITPTCVVPSVVQISVSGIWPPSPHPGVTPTKTLEDGVSEWPPGGSTLSRVGMWGGQESGGSADRAYLLPADRPQNSRLSTFCSQDDPRLSCLSWGWG